MGASLKSLDWDMEWTVEWNGECTLAGAWRQPRPQATPRFYLAAVEKKRLRGHISRAR